MAELLVANFNRPPYRRGDVVALKANDHVYGSAEGLPDFVIIKVPAVTMTDLLPYYKSWRKELDYEVVSWDNGSDTGRIRIFITNPGASNVATVTLEQVQSFLDSWNLSYVSGALNEVIFESDVYQAIISQGFWRINLSGVIWTEVSYGVDSGIHRVRADYSAIGNNSTHVETYVSGMGGIVISNAAKVIEFDISRATIMDAFISTVKQLIQIRFKPSRYYFGSGIMNNIVAQGGAVVTTMSELQTYIIDKYLE